MASRKCQDIHKIVTTSLITLASLLSADEAVADSALSFKPYGFIHANFSAASKGLESFGYQNQSAPTAVSPSIEASSDRARSTFQVAQSRLGFFVESEVTQGQIEIDFIDFARASPNQSANPRLRIANVDYHLDSHRTLSFGQIWDIFSSPRKPFTYNIVGLYFETGNIGFMRPQFRYTYQTDSSWTFATAVGLAAKNTNSQDGEIEKSGIPTLAFTAINDSTHGLQWGGSVIVSEVRPVASSAPLSLVWGVNTFFSTESEQGFKTRSSVYVGRNLASIGTLSLARVTEDRSHSEIGGYFTFFNPISHWFSFQGGLGGATVLESSGSPLDSIANVTVNSNLKAELALSYHPQKESDIYIQTTYMNTAYTGAIRDELTKNTAIALQFGSVYRF
jgi:hypothetical protein